MPAVKRDCNSCSETAFAKVLVGKCWLVKRGYSSFSENVFARASAGS